MFRLLIPAALLAIAACSPLTSPRGLTVFLNATPSAGAVGDTIVFVATAQGSPLAEVAISYGDGTRERVDAAGSTTIQAGFRHVYATVGTFQVQATARDARNEVKTASLTVAIQ